MRACVITHGCKVNQADSALLGRLLEEGGWEVVREPEGAGLIIVNTCTVTARADADGRSSIRRAHRLAPDAPIVVMGCLAQRDPEALLALEGVSLVVGLEQRPRLLELLGGLMAHRATGPVPIYGAGRLGRGEARRLVKVQEGCEGRCTYCIVPQVRGRERSLEAGAVMELVLREVEAGVGEVVLTGVRLGAYGRDGAAGLDLAGLLEILGPRMGRARLRLSSLEPLEISPRLLGVMASQDRICHHLHVALQSGSDELLRSMARPYRADQALERLLAFREALPGAGLGLDVIVGFPGEGEGDHRATMDLVRRVRPSYLHVFSYSPRPGTVAAGYGGRVASDVVKERSRELRAWGVEAREAFGRSLGGLEEEVLLEGRREGTTGLAVGLTGTYMPVLVEGLGEARPGRLVGARWVSFEGGWGRVVSQDDSLREGEGEAPTTHG